jgi:putative endonuclease
MKNPPRSLYRHPERSASGAQSKDPVALQIDAVQLPPSGTGEYWIYILTNERRTVLYVGITNDLAARLAQHIRGLGGGFTRQYRADCLVYYENLPEPTQAIAREKQLKGWTRAKKVALISKVNPEFADLAPMLFGREWKEAILADSRHEIGRDPSTTRLVPRRFAQDDGGDGESIES